MKFSDIAFPGSVILIKFLFKAFLGQEMSVAVFVKSFQTLPLDIAFFAVSLFVAYDRVYQPDGKAFGAWVVCLLLVSGVCVLLSRWADKLLVAERNWPSHGVTFLNLLISTSSLSYVLALLTTA